MAAAAASTGGRIFIGYGGLLSVCRQEQALGQGVPLNGSHFFPRDEYFMRLALREAERAAQHDDVPIGCVVVADGEVVAAAPNERELRGDPTAHAEVLALREAAIRVGDGWRMPADAVLYVTLEPCAMCAGALVLARMPRVVFGAWDPKAGAAGSVVGVFGGARPNRGAGGGGGGP